MSLQNTSVGQPDPRVVGIVRLAFLLSAGLFGAAVGFLRSKGLESVDSEQARALGIAGKAVWAVALAACLFLAARVRAGREPGRAYAQSIVGWAIAESTAIFGATYWFLVGTSQWYFSGLGFLALVLIMLPGVRRA
jgi:hypothetical protein